MARHAFIAVAVITAIGMGDGTARADGFEDKATNAVKVARVDDLVWAVTATCDKGDDVINRQCRRVRDTRKAQLAGKPLLIDADPKMFVVGPWNAAKKSAQVTVAGCFACDGIVDAGKSWLVYATPPRIDDGKVWARAVSDKSLPFESEAARTKFASSVAKVRVQFVVQLPANPRWQLAGKDGISLDLLAYRVITPCDGNVVLASPASAPVAADPKACTK